VGIHQAGKDHHSPGIYDAIRYTGQCLRRPYLLDDVVADEQTAAGNLAARVIHGYQQISMLDQQCRHSFM